MEMTSTSRQGHSNLLSFINATTPSVLTRTLSKRSFQEWDKLWLPARDTVEVFSLRELWNQYIEWSAYGAGAEVLLHGGDKVKQYYVPYLSAIQIYTSKSRASSRNGLSNCWSNGSAYKKLVNPRGSPEDTSSDDGIQQAQEKWGYLYCQFFESITPYGRLPLFEKVRELSNIYPGLMSFKSAELSPASWMSVAWYPIYHIPARRNVKDLSACFLTYHCLTSPYQDHMQVSTPKSLSSTGAWRSASKSEEKSNRISLHPFGLATYKAQGKLWLNCDNGDDERIVSLYGAANCWLNQRKVHHNDFNFFITH